MRYSECRSFCSDIKIRLFCSVLVLCFLVFCLNTAHGMEAKYLLVHLDAISADEFYRHWEAGNLPNLQTIFSDGVTTQALTLFPPGTEIITKRMRIGQSNGQGLPVAWEHYDRGSGQIIGSLGFIFDLYTTLPSISRSQYLMGIPVLSHITGMKLVNIPSLLRQYDVLEYYWFHTDVVGHYLGGVALEKSLAQFDYYMGMLYQAGIPENLNIILYADHGMTTGDIERVPLNQIISEVAGDDMMFFHFPSLYLNKNAPTEDIARELSSKEGIHFTFVKLAEDLVRGYHARGMIDIHKVGDKYSMMIAGADPFTYGDRICDGLYLTKDEWLKLTRDSYYPAVPPNVFDFASNPNSGDVIITLDPSKIPDNFGANGGQHISLARTDTLVPILVRGPIATSRFSADQPVWLHELIGVHLPALDLNASPKSEATLIEFGVSKSGKQFEVAISPAERIQAGLTHSLDEWDFWLAFDINRSFITKLWIGPTINNQGVGWQTRFELSLARFNWEYRYHNKLGNISRVGFDITESLQLFYSSQGVLGLTAYF